MHGKRNKRDADVAVSHKMFAHKYKHIYLGVTLPVCNTALTPLLNTIDSKENTDRDHIWGLEGLSKFYLNFVDENFYPRKGRNFGREPTKIPANISHTGKTHRCL